MSLDSKKPIFISGLYRSGTTILTRIIDKDSTIKCTYDTIHYLRFSYDKYRPIEKNYKELIRDTKKRVEEKWDLLVDEEKIVSNIEKESKITESVVYDSMMNAFLDIKSGERWAEKTNVEWESIKGFLKMFPNGKVIHVYRDPRAVIASYKHMTNQPAPRYLDGIFASLALFNFMEEDEIKDNKNILLLKYEDFVESPKEYVEKICNFLDISFDEDMLDVTTFKDKKGKQFVTNSSFTKPKTKIDKDSLDLWKEKLNRVEIYLIEMFLRDKMVSFDYELAGIDLNKEEHDELYEILNHDFINKRYKYILKHGNGQQAYPNTEDAYEL